MLVLKTLRKFIPRRLHQGCMEWSADCDRHDSSCTLLHHQLSGSCDNRCITGYSYLNRCVIVCNLSDMELAVCKFILSLLAACLNSITVETHNSDHTGISTGNCLFHRFTTVCNKIDYLLFLEYTCRIECRILTKRKSGCNLRYDALCCKNLCHANRKGYHTWLCVSCLSKLLDWTVKTTLLHIKIQLYIVKYFAELRICLIEIFSHSDMLCTLASI